MNTKFQSRNILLVVAFSWTIQGIDYSEVFPHAAFMQSVFCGGILYGRVLRFVS